MQINGVPVSIYFILVKGNEIYCFMYGKTRSTGFLGRGWLNRFVNRHPLQTLSSSKIIKRIRKEATLGGSQNFQQNIKVCGQEKILPGRLFKMEKTGFSKNSKSKKCVAFIGFKNVWSKYVDPDFHLNITSCVPSNVFFNTPMFLSLFNK